MKKIIFGITSLTLGGAERVLVDIANKLVKNYDITIFTIYANGELEKELNPKIHLISLYTKKYIDLNKIEKIVIPLKILLTKKKIFKKYIANDEYLAQISFLEGAITRIFSTKIKNNDSKKIAWVHNDISRVFGKNLKSKLKIGLDTKTYEKYNTIIFVSNDNLKKFNEIYKKNKVSKKYVIHNYINAERILKLSEQEQENAFNSNEINILQVSRLVEQKAIDRLIDVHNKMIKEGKSHHIYIIGDGPLKEKLNNKIKEKQLEKTFTLLGAKVNPYPYMKNANAFVLFSYFEGYPMVIEEAKILNKYIVITNTSAREALTDYTKNSEIVTNDEKGIEDAITKIVEKKSKNIEENTNYIYTNDKIIDKIIKIIEEEK